MQKPLVSILCITYNHQHFIAQAIDSFLMQKTNFAFEIVIGEDFSQDATSQICKEYQKKHPHIISLFSRTENLGAQENFIRTFSACRGEYIAFCEGDDYWTDPYKLQKQADFLERNPEYGLIHTDIMVVDLTGELGKERLFGEKEICPDDYCFYKLLKENFINSLTVMFRKSIINLDLLLNKRNREYIIDYWLWLNIAITHKIYYWPVVTAAYRKHNEGYIKSKKARFKPRKIRAELLLRYLSVKNKLPKKEKLVLAKHIWVLCKRKGLTLRMRLLLFLAIFIVFKKRIE